MSIRLDAGSDGMAAGTAAGGDLTGTYPNPTLAVDRALKTTTISAGTGLTGGGDLSANRTLTLANTAVTPAAYGSASTVGTFTVDQQGRLTAAASTSIAIAESAVTNLTTDLAAKATDSLVVHLAGTESVTGAKSFTSATGVAATGPFIGPAAAGSGTGSKSSPSFQFSGDSDTGLYSTGANIVALAAGGARVADWTGSNGAVGFYAPTSQNSSLTMVGQVAYGSGGSQSITFNDGTVNTAILQNATGATYLDSNYGAINLRTGSAGSVTAALTLSTAQAATFSGTLAVTGDATFSGHILPAVDNSKDLGSASKQYEYGYFGSAVRLSPNKYVGWGSAGSYPNQILADGASTMSFYTSSANTATLNASAFYTASGVNLGVGASPLTTIYALAPANTDANLRLDGGSTTGNAILTLNSASTNPRITFNSGASEKGKINCETTTPALSVHSDSGAAAAGTAYTTLMASQVEALNAYSNKVDVKVQMKYSATNTTGAGSAALGANSPATTNTAPYTWFRVTTSDGSTGYIPVWK